MILMRIPLVDPFTGDNIRLGERAKSLKEVEETAPEPYKTHKDYLYVEKYKGRNLKRDFLLKAEGDYEETEIEEIVRRWSRKNG